MRLEAIVEKAASGDVTAFSTLVERCWRFVYAICLDMVGRATEAEDLTQQVFIRVYTDLPKLREARKLLPWLRRVARNVCLMRLRQQRPTSVPLETAEGKPDSAAAADLRRVELQELLGAALAGVSAKNREVLTLRYLAGCSEADISAALRIAPALVKSRLHEGRAQAKRKLLPAVQELLALRTPSRALAEQIIARCGKPGCVCPDTLIEGR